VLQASSFRVEHSQRQLTSGGGGGPVAQHDNDRTSLFPVVITTFNDYCYCFTLAADYYMKVLNTELDCAFNCHSYWNEELDTTHMEEQLNRSFFKRNLSRLCESLTLCIERLN